MSKGTLVIWRSANTRCSLTLCSAWKENSTEKTNLRARHVLWKPQQTPPVWHASSPICVDWRDDVTPNLFVLYGFRKHLQNATVFILEMSRFRAQCSLRKPGRHDVATNSKVPKSASFIGGDNPQPFGARTATMICGKKCFITWIQRPGRGYERKGWIFKHMWAETSKQIPPEKSWWLTATVSGIQKVLGSFSWIPWQNILIDQSSRSPAIFSVYFSYTTCRIEKPCEQPLRSQWSCG